MQIIQEICREIIVAGDKFNFFRTFKKENNY